MSRASWLVLWWLLASATSQLVAQGTSSTPPSTDTVQPSPPITPTERAVLQTLRMSLGQALSLSETSDANWQTSQQAQSAAEKQRQIDNEQRTQDQAQSSKDLAAAQATAQLLQGYLDQLLPKLTDFSGSEDQKVKAAVKAVDTIKLDAKALEFQVSILKIGCVTLGVGLGAVAVYELGRVVKWWK
jgi:hypothetical protein